LPPNVSNAPTAASANPDTISSLPRVMIRV
jgi:hypothetical protein